MSLDNPQRVEAHDDVESVVSATLSPDGLQLTVVYQLRPADYSGENLTLHSTNGVNHTYVPVARKRKGK